MSLKMKTCFRQALAFYGATLPYHPGKWRVVDALHHKLRLAPDDPSASWEVSRRGLHWGLRFDCCIQRAVYYLGVYERAETRWLESRLMPGMGFLDIGSNFGYYTLLAARAMEGQGRILAFEPYIPNREQLQANLARNHMDWVEVEACALADAPGTLDFVIPPDSCLGVGHIETHPGTHARTVQVDVRTLDTVAGEKGLDRLDAVKLDVEGAEVRVLKGGQKTFQRFKPDLLVEINPDGLRSFDTEAAELVAILTGWGYRLHRARGGRLERIDLGPDTDYDAVFGDHGNTIALHPRRGVPS